MKLGAEIPNYLLLIKISEITLKTTRLALAPKCAKCLQELCLFSSVSVILRHNSLAAFERPSDDGFAPLKRQLFGVMRLIFRITHVFRLLVGPQKNQWLDDICAAIPGHTEHRFSVSAPQNTFIPRTNGFI